MNLNLPLKFKVGQPKAFSSGASLAPKVVDVVIVGGGPAGSQCALSMKMLGFRPLIVEKSSCLGGLLRDDPYQNNWLACTPPMSGEQLGQTLEGAIKRHNIEAYCNTELHTIVSTKLGLIITLNTDVTTIMARRLVIATGVTPRTGGFHASARVLIGSGKNIDCHDFTGKSVAILGGGDTALENYHLILAKGACAVTVFARTVRARRAFVASVPKEALVVGDCVADQMRMTVNGKSFDCMCIMFGFNPVNPLADHVALSTDSQGFIRVDHACRTICEPNIFAIGECTQRLYPCLMTAMADGFIAATAIRSDLENEVGGPRV